MLPQQGRFKGIMVAVTPCRSDMSAAGLAPGAHLCDGHAQLLLVRDVPRLTFLCFLASIPRGGAPCATPDQLLAVPLGKLSSANRSAWRSSLVVATLPVASSIDCLGKRKQQVQSTGFLSILDLPISFMLLPGPCISTWICSSAGCLIGVHAAVRMCAFCRLHRTMAHICCFLQPALRAVTVRR